MNWMPIIRIWYSNIISAGFQKTTYTIVKMIYFKRSAYCCEKNIRNYKMLKMMQFFINILSGPQLLFILFLIIWLLQNFDSSVFGYCKILISQCLVTAKVQFLSIWLPQNFNFSVFGYGKFSITQYLVTAKFQNFRITWSIMLHKLNAIFTLTLHTQVTLFPYQLKRFGY